MFNTRYYVSELKKFSAEGWKILPCENTDGVAEKKELMKNYRVRCGYTLDREKNVHNFILVKEKEV